METSVQDDRQFIQLALAGDTAAFGELVTKYQDRLYNTLVHVVGSPEDASDLAQEAFVQAFVKLDTFRGNAAFYTWLYRIALNRAISWKRKQRPTQSLDHAREAAGDEPTDEHATPDESLLQQERVTQVQTALAALNEEHRTILVLREIDGCGYDAISEILELPVGTVRSRLHRARMQLREQLKATVSEESS